MKRTISALAVVAGASSVLILALAGPASAHEVRQVGAYQFTVGWGEEPAYAGVRNSVQLILKHDGKPVTTLTDTLKLEVIYGTQKEPLSLEPTFDPDTGLGTPGDYRGWLIPTAPGKYTFHFSGTIGKQNIDQSFTSSPTSFDEVQSPAAAEFPVKPPTNAELAGKVTSQDGRLASAETATQQAHNAASSAKTVAFIGIVVGAIGLLVAVAALVRSSRRPASRAEPSPVETATPSSARN